MTRRLRVFLIVTACEILALGSLYLHAVARVDVAETHVMPANRTLAGDLELTDLALWSEARYTRHPSQADHFAPFQDFPSAVEHFPAGSIVAAPRPPASPEQERR